jgi:hypothetical protein
VRMYVFMCIHVCLYVRMCVCIYVCSLFRAKVVNNAEWYPLYLFSSLTNRIRLLAEENFHFPIFLIADSIKKLDLVSVLM